MGNQKDLFDRLFSDQEEDSNEPYFRKIAVKQRKWAVSFFVAGVLFEYEVISFSGRFLFLDFSEYDAVVFSSLLYSAVVFFAIFTCSLIPNLVRRYGTYLFDTYMQSNVGEFTIRDSIDKVLDSDQDRIRGIIARNAEEADGIIDEFNKRQSEQENSTTLPNIEAASSAKQTFHSAWYADRIDFESQASVEKYVDKIRERISTLRDTSVDINKRRSALWYNAEKRFRSSKTRKIVFYISQGLIDSLRISPTIILGLIAAAKIATNT